MSKKLNKAGWQEVAESLNIKFQEDDSIMSLVERVALHLKVTIDTKLTPDAFKKQVLEAYEEDKKNPKKSEAKSSDKKADKKPEKKAKKSSSKDEMKEKGDRFQAYAYRQPHSIATLEAGALKIFKGPDVKMVMHNPHQAHFEVDGIRFPEIGHYTIAL